MKDETLTFQLLPFLCSKTFRYYLEHFENHTVAKNQIDLLEVPIPANFHTVPKIKTLCKSVIEKIKLNQSYDYVSNEQIEIDRLVYEAYGLNAEDVEEVENWYARRYSKLSNAQKQNLRNLGKSDDYLELYGLR